MNERKGMSSILTVLLSGAALVLAAAACSDSDDNKGGGGPGAGGAGGSGGGPGGGGSYTLDDVCERIAPRQCADARACCESSVAGYDQAGCEAGMLRDCEAGVAKVKEGKMTFNAGSVDACLNTLKGTYQKCEFAFAELIEIGDIADACHVFLGNIEVGGACEEDAECKQPSDDKELAHCIHGKCTLESLGEAGEGADCGEETSCGPGLYCSEDDKCAKAKAIGEACTWPGECASWSCQAGQCAEGNKISIASGALCKGEEDEESDF